MTGIEIVQRIYQMVNVPSVQALLGSGSVWQHNRPVNSPYPDVVVSLPVFDGNSRTINYIDVNVHTPNLDGYYPITGSGEDHTFPDLDLHKQLVDTILPLIVSGPGYSLDPAIKGVPIRDSDGQWYSNIRISIVTLDDAAALDSELQDMVSFPDGYGGHRVTYTQIWAGKAERTLISDGSQVQTEDGRTDLIRRVTWRLPATGLTPQKYHRLVNSAGIFNILGISPEGPSFWKLVTARKDGPN